MRLPRLWLVSDDSIAPQRLAEVWTQVARALPEGSVGLSVRCRVLEARHLASLCARLVRTAPQPVVVSRRVDVALSSEMAGVHLPANGVSVADARTLLSNQQLVLRAVHGEVELRQAVDADGVFAAPVFTPRSHASERTPLGLEGLQALCAATDVPVLALGGVRLENVEALRRAGAHGIAVNTQVFGAPDPMVAAWELHQALGA